MSQPAKEKVLHWPPPYQRAATIPSPIQRATGTPAHWQPRYDARVPVPLAQPRPSIPPRTGGAAQPRVALPGAPGHSASRISPGAVFLGRAAAPGPRRPAQAKSAARPGAVQRYSIREVYEKAHKHAMPNDEVLHDLQIIHDRLNGSEGYFRKYLKDVDDLIKDRPQGWTATRRLRVHLATEDKLKLPKIFATPTSKDPVGLENEFLDVAKKTGGHAFHDVAAGLFHGEYEHGLQMQFIKEMYLYPYTYGGTGLRTSFQQVWAAIVNPLYTVRVDEGLALSLWSIVMDIRGGFASGAQPGLRQLLGPGVYADTFGTSATVLHHGFGAWNKGMYPNVRFGSLQSEFPNLSKAVVDRHNKRAHQKETQTLPTENVRL